MRLRSGRAFLEQVVFSLGPKLKGKFTNKFILKWKKRRLKAEGEGGMNDAPEGTEAKPRVNKSKFLGKREETACMGISVPRKSLWA